ncbi:MAG: type II secretion system secretin GspD [Alphaproteobacteria bacterium]|nr:type II secretion system secretin GspD [Alphaproteobacteria bacterium]
MHRLVAFAVLLSALLVAPMSGNAQGNSGLNYQNADLRVFIKDIALETGITFIIDPRVRGKVDIFSQSRVDRDSLVEILKSVLKINKFSAVPLASGGFKIVPVDEAMRDASQSAPLAGDGYVTRVFDIKFVDPTMVFNAVKPLVNKKSSASFAKGQRKIIVTDFGGNVGKIAKLIADMDQDKSETRTLVLQNTSALAMARVLDDLITSQGSNAKRNLALRAIPVKGGNTLIVRGYAEALDYYVPILRSIDEQSLSGSAIRVHKLKYGSAESMLPMLQTLANAKAQEGTTSAGDVTISAYAANNAIIVNADSETQKWIADVIDELDTAQPQVLVEAIIVEVSDNASRDLGVQYLMAGGRDTTIPFTVTNYGTSAPNILATTGAIIAEGDNGDDSGSSIKGLLRSRALDSFLGSRGLIVGAGTTRSDGSVFGVILNALQRDVSSNILSTPSIMTLDNEKASFIVGQEIPITTGEALGSSNSNPFRTIDRKNVGVQLDVQPQINDDGDIRLKIRQEVSSVTGPLVSGSTELITSKREMETTVRVGNGEVVVLGGLVRQDERVTVDRIPLLGSIPLLGHLFRSSGRANEKTNLMIFLRPTIVRSAEDAESVTTRQFNTMRGLDGEGIPDIDIDALIRNKGKGNERR